MTETQPEAVEMPFLRPFVAFLQEVRGGALVADLTTELSGLVSQCKFHGKPGSITLKLDVKPNGRTLFVTPTITTKLPKVAEESTVFFADRAGNLLRDDPEQPALPGLKSVTVADPVPPRAVGNDREGQ